MIDRKVLKQNAKINMKKHYWIFFLICLIAAFIGAEFASSLDSLSFVTSDENITESAVTAFSDSLQLTSTDVGSHVLEKLVDGKIQDAIKSVNDAEERMKSKDLGPVLGLQKGVFSSLINTKASGGFYVMAFKMIRSVVTSETVGAVIFSILVIIFELGFLFFVKECYTVFMRRIILEGRTYERFSTSSIKRHFKGIRWPKMTWTLFVTFVYSILWSLTIVMIPVKFCSYAMVPYILAENPKMKANEVITLSRKMMDGHKWEFFKIYLSLIPWYILDILTLGLFGLFFTNIYQTAIISEYYAVIRAEAKAKGILNADQMNDDVLFEKPSLEVMKKAYADVWEVIEQPLPEIEAPKGIQGFLIKWFGIMLLPTKKNLEYEKQYATINTIERLKYIAEGKRYPGRLYAGNDGGEKVSLSAPGYLRNYTVISLILMFFIFAFVGWAWEVSLHLFKDGVFVNRGTMHGPWLPIYGAGCVMILVLLKRFRSKPALEFLMAILLCGVVEYFTHLYLEMNFGIKWWDYTGYFLNLNGRICAEGLLVFGVGGVAVVYGAAPFLDNLLRKLNVKVAVTLCVILLCTFICDQIYSHFYPNTGKGITDYGESSVRVEIMLSQTTKSLARPAGEVLTQWAERV